MAGAFQRAISGLHGAVLRSGLVPYSTRNNTDVPALDHYRALTPVWRMRQFSRAAEGVFRCDWTADPNSPHVPPAVHEPPTAVLLQPVAFTLAPQAAQTKRTVPLQPVTFSFAQPALTLLTGQVAALEPVVFTLAAPAVAAKRTVLLEAVAFTFAQPALTLPPPGQLALLAPVVFTLTSPALDLEAGLLTAELEPVVFRLRPIAGSLTFPGVPVALPFPPRPLPALALPVRTLRRSFHLLLTLPGTTLEAPVSQASVQLRAPQAGTESGPSYQTIYQYSQTTSMRSVRDGPFAVPSTERQEQTLRVTGFRDPATGRSYEQHRTWSKTSSWEDSAGGIISHKASTAWRPFAATPDGL